MFSLKPDLRVLTRELHMLSSDTVYTSASWKRRTGEKNVQLVADLDENRFRLFPSEDNYSAEDAPSGACERPRRARAMDAKTRARGHARTAIIEPRKNSARFRPLCPRDTKDSRGIFRAAFSRGSNGARTMPGDCKCFFLLLHRLRLFLYFLADRAPDVDIKT